MAAKKKARKTGKSKKKTGRANGTVRPSKSSSKRKPKPAVVRRPSKKTAKKTAKKRAVRKKIPRLPRPSLAPKTIKAISLSFGKLTEIRNLEARLLEAQQRVRDEEDERKAIQEESDWSGSHPSKIVQQWQKTIDDWASIDDQNDPRVIARLATFIEVTSYKKQDGSEGLFPSRLRHIEDSEDIKKRLAEHLFATEAWNEEAKKIAREYDVWTREVYTLFYSP